jgi:uncharacterized damage-inducible protein DinB
MSKSNILNHLDENWQALVQALSGLSEKDLMEPNVCGSWSVREIMSHISTWEEEALQNIPLILDGEATPRYSSSGGITAFNDRAQTDKKEYTLSRVKREFYATHQKFVTFLSALPDAVYLNNSRLAKRIRLDGYDHYQEHTAQIEIWRALRTQN